MPTLPTRNKLVILCDGTWCGRETGTETNISLLASAIGIPNSKAPTDQEPRTFSNPDRHLHASYFAGCGLGGTFLSYLFDGATGNDIGKDCMAAYRYIVEHFNDQTEIWMFGHSRGSYTVRCVAGMINNCGIVKPRKDPNETEFLISEVYKMYRSPYEEDEPNKPKAKNFRDKASWIINYPAIKFMGIIDTVGSLGIPRLNAGVGLDWPEFYDHIVSSEVEKLYHAHAIHDRLWCFVPCRALRDPKKKTNPELQIFERWFPGCHYDVGRQKFKFFRSGVNIVEQVIFALPNLLTKPVMPNVVCADLVLLWILEAIKTHDTTDSLLASGVDKEILKVRSSLASDNIDTGSGDVYSHALDFSPVGIIGSSISRLTSTVSNITNYLTPNLHLGSAVQSFLGLKTINDILLATRDRRIPDVNADVTSLEAKVGGKTIKDKAGLSRYDSKTEKRWQLVRKIVTNAKL